MSFCVYCGAPLGEGMRFCSACGKPAYIPPSAPQTPPQQTAPQYTAPQYASFGAQQAMPQQTAPRTAQAAGYNTQMSPMPADPAMEPVFYEGVCLQRLDGVRTVPGDCIITARGLFYYSREMFKKQIGKRQYDFWIDSRNVGDIRTSVKNMNKVMELYLRDGSVKEFYSPKFDQMLSAMQKAVRG